MLCLWRREDVVGRFPLVQVVVPLEQREVVNPYQRHVVFIHELEPARHFVAQVREDGVYQSGSTGNDEHEVAGFCARFVCELLDDIDRQELFKWRLDVVVF